MRDRSRIIAPMNKLNTTERAQIIRCLVDGNSIAATCRICGRSKRAVLRLLCDLGKACAKFHNENVRGIPSARIQVDEIWNFCYAKKKNVPAEFDGKFGYGDVWTWVGVDADTKLIISYHVGKRDGWDAHQFIGDLRDRVVNNPQLTSDALRAYLKPVAEFFGADADYAQLLKVFGPTSHGTESRYSPPEVIACVATPISGNPDPRHISTSYVERSNLTMRMSMRRFTRLTNAFSKKLENLKHSVEVNFMYYNYCRIHQTLRVTPAMEAGLADHVWEVEELIDLLD